MTRAIPWEIKRRKWTNQQFFPRSPQSPTYLVIDKARCPSLAFELLY
jgi:hypothetical protein